MVSYIFVLFEAMGGGAWEASIPNPCWQAIEGRGLLGGQIGIFVPSLH